MHTWRRANYKDLPKKPPHLVIVSKRAFFEAFDSSEIGVIHLPVISEPIRLEKNLTKVRVNIQGYAGDWSDFCEMAHLYLRGYEIFRSIMSAPVRERGIILTIEEGKYIAACAFNPHIRTKFQKVRLLRKVNVALKDVEPQMDHAMREMGVIDWDGDYLYTGEE